MTDSTRRRPRRKSRTKAKLKKPRKNFPLSIHQGSGYWCKKVLGRVHYFGKVADDPKGVRALEQWLEVKDDLVAGREPRAKSDGLTVADLCNAFLTHKQNLRDNRELNVRTFRGHFDSCAGVVKALGRNRTVTDLTPDDFRKLRVKLAKTRGAVALRNEMQRVRGIFKFAFDEGLILAPIRFGQSFTKPKLDAVRRAREEHRAKHGDRRRRRGHCVFCAIVCMRRRNDERLHVEGMSDGTRDQLYLSLRLGYVEQRLSRHEPMPFVVDDILVNFDADRSLATLQVLAELSRHTQVIFFTHHNHLVELAESALSPEDVFFHPLTSESRKVKKLSRAINHRKNSTFRQQ